MHADISAGKKPDGSIKADYGMAVVIEVTLVHPVPVVHLVVVLVEMGGIVIDAKEHLEIVGRVVPQGIKHYFAIVKILKHIGC